MSHPLTARGVLRHPRGRRGARIVRIARANDQRRESWDPMRPLPGPPGPRPGQGRRQLSRVDPSAQPGHEELAAIPLGDLQIHPIVGQGGIRTSSGGEEGALVAKEPGVLDPTEQGDGSGGYSTMCRDNDSDSDSGDREDSSSSICQLPGGA